MLNRKACRLTVDEAKLLNLDLSISSLDEQNALMDERSCAPWKQARAYLGWILTNSVFIAERKALFETHRHEILLYGFPRSTRTELSSVPNIPGETGAQSLVFVNAVRLFCERWRLLSFDGPLLVTPMQPQLPALYPSANARSFKRGVPVYEIPDICSVPSRGPLGDIVHESLGHEVPQVSHLADWMAAVERSNSSRTTLSKYERLFVFQHYMRVLYGRHGDSLSRCGVHVRKAIAEFMEQNHIPSNKERGVPDFEELLRKDQQSLNRQLGKTWPKDPQL